MSSTPHVRAQLSAYLDAALATADRNAVEAHLASCTDCRARLAELRDTASLIGALPDLAPTRRLVPRLAPVPVWLAPLRTLATLASGVSVFLFIASALLANIGTLSAGSATTALNAPAAAPAASGGGVAAAPAPAGGLASASATTPRGAIQAPSATPQPNADTSKAFTTASAAPTAAEAARGATSVPNDAVSNAAGDRSSHEVANPGPATNPWVWLVLAIVTGAIALALHRRLRSA
jgi:anti-sigma factor RsiW